MFGRDQVNGPPGDVVTLKARLCEAGLLGAELRVQGGLLIGSLGGAAV